MQTETKTLRHWREKKRQNGQTNKDESLAGDGEGVKSLLWFHTFMNDWNNSENQEEEEEEESVEMKGKWYGKEWGKKGMPRISLHQTKPAWHMVCG